MALWFVRGLRRGVVTTRYPAGTDAWAGMLPSPPRFDPLRLDQDVANRLVEVCPSRAFHKAPYALILDVGACSGCGRCLGVAGDAARPSGEFELAATDRRHLRKTIPILGGR